MIPKLAHFYWSGPPMSWLRQQSIESFKMHNPTWSVELHLGSDSSSSRTQRVIQSDRSRYEILFQIGGMYFDTDILFVAPIPDEWLVRDNAMVLGETGIAMGIGVLGSQSGSRLFAGMMAECDRRAESNIVWSYQSFGLKLIAGLDMRQVAMKHGETIHSIPFPSLFPVRWNDLERLWSPINLDLGDNLVGVHWFGGDELSIEYEWKITPDSIEDVPCPITDILKRNGNGSTLVSGADSIAPYDTLRGEQHHGTS